MINFTEAATKKLQSVLEEENRQGQSIRITGQRGVTPLAVEYGLTFVGPDDVDTADRTFEMDGFNVYVDPESLPMVEGVTVDYVHGLNETGFKITNPRTAAPTVPTGPVIDKVQEVIRSRINPAIASHGGNIALVDVKDKVAYLRFGGGCQGCGMVDVTLKQGVEVMIKEAVPEIEGVMDVTEHADGKNPYYQPAK